MSAARSRRASAGNRELFLDLAAWKQTQGEDNREQLDRLRRNLGRARRQELTARQQQMLHLYYDQGLTMPQIARELQVSKSSVSRTLARGRERLRKYLQYSL